VSENPFAGYNVEIPKKYSEEIKKFCQTAGGKVTFEFAPFNRQIDFWYFSFLYAVKNNLAPIAEPDTSNITPASILSSNAYRISHIQLLFLGLNQDLKLLANHRKVFDFALQMANAGIPYVLQILNDQEDRPLWSLLDSVEGNI
jgi:hypothetical protein